MTWTIMTISLIGAQILVAALSWPMVARRVRPNRWYGFRTPATLADERVWYEANAASGRYLLGSTLLSAAVSLAAYLTLTPLDSMLASLTFWTISICVATGMSFVALRRITRA